MPKWNNKGFAQFRRDVAEVFAGCRRTCGLGRNATAQRATCASATISALEDGDATTSPGLWTLYSVADAMGYDIVMTLKDRGTGIEIAVPVVRDTEGQILLNGELASSTKSVGD